MPRADRIVLMLAAGLLLCGVEAFAAVCKTPRSWLPKAVNSPMDQNQDGIHDVLQTLAPDDLVEVVVDLNRCPTDEEVAVLAAFGPVKFWGKWLSVVVLENVRAGDLGALAELSHVAFVEHNRPITLMLDRSNPTLKVKPSPEYSPDTVDDAYPGITGEGINIAIVDSGVDDQFHEAFDQKFVGGSDCSMDPCVDGNPDDLDPGGHGTSVAGIALGIGNFVSRQGIARGAGLVDISVNGPGTLADVLFRSLERILTNRVLWDVSVVNLSLGDCNHTAGTDSVSEMANRMVDEGMTVVVSAGNCDSCDQPFSCKLVMAPGAADRVISVANSLLFGTVDRGDDMINLNSANGPRDSDYDNISSDELKPDITAPGTLISVPEAGTTQGYHAFGGTSAAAPHVAGCAALLLQQKPDLRPASLKELLLSTAEDKGLSGWDPSWGNGLIDCYAALDELNTLIRQADVRFDEGCGGSGQDPCWLHPSLYPTDPAVADGVPNTVNADLFNFGPNDVTGVSVRLSVYNFSNGDLTYDICIVPVDLLSGETQIVSCDWTPIVSGSPPGTVHACLKAEIIYPNDTDFSNNFAQHNLNIEQTASPATVRMEVDNKTDQFLTMDVREVYDCPRGECSGWQFSTSHDLFPMAADSCPRNIELSLEPVQPDALREARVLAHIFGIPQTGPDIDQGGAAIEARIGCLTRNLVATGKTQFDFDADPFFTSCPQLFDVARGALPILPYPSQTLRGNFNGMTCIANNVAGSEFAALGTPDTGSGFFYLARAGGPLPGSWDSGGAAQAGRRDDTTGATCP